MYYRPGTQVRVTQQIPRRIDTYTITITGTVLRHERQFTGSWFAHNKLNRFWLDRLIVEKDDGEITVLNLDACSAVEGMGVEGDAPLVEPAEDVTANLT